MPCLPPHCAPASHRTNATLLLQLEACSYKKDFFLLTIGSGGHLLGMNFGAGGQRGLAVSPGKPVTACSTTHTCGLT